MIKEIIILAESLTPVALIGVGGIGKTSIALAILHHDRVKRRFGGNRRFIRCDQFPPTLAHLLSRISKVIGAGIQNPENLTTLYPFLSSKEMMVVLDNAESILDPRGVDSAKIYALVEELSRLETICLCITSRVSTVPPECETLNIPTLSMNAARDTFYRIYKKGEQSNLISNILKQLDFHPLSITLLATVAHQNGWGMDRLTKEWERQRTGVLQTQHDKSLAAAIELSLASPLFQELGPDARGLLGVVAFFPQGVDENNLDRLFPSIPNRSNIFDKFCILSVTYRSNGFITMLAPLRDYLSPKDPKSSPLLCATKECYFTRMTTDVHPDQPNFRETRWIAAEDMNVEHLLDVFTTIDADSGDVWKACANFMRNLYWHKKRLTVLGLKIEGLPDYHCSKPECLVELARLFESVGNHVEQKRLLIHALKLWRERGSDHYVARTLRELSDANRIVGLYEEGIQQAEEALVIFGRLGDTVAQAGGLISLAFLLHDIGRLDAAEEAAFGAIDLLPEEGNQFLACESHRILGYVYQSKGDTEKAIHYFKIVLGIASPINWHGQLFWVYHSLALLSLDESRFGDAQARVEQAESHAVDHTYYLGHAMILRAEIWYRQHRLEEARFETLRAAGVFEKLGAVTDLEWCSERLRRIQNELNNPVAS